jgi:hypothetical protein
METKKQRRLTLAEKTNIQNIEKQLFRVFKVNNLVPMTLNRKKFHPITDKYAVYKTHGGKYLGLVGKVFVEMQPKEFLDNIVETVKDFGADLDLTTLTFNQYCGGSKIEFRIEINPIRFQNQVQKIINMGKPLSKLRDEDLDVTKLYLTFSTSYNGSKPNTISLFTHRLICKNGMVANKLEGTLKGRNTMNGKLNILSYGEEVAKIINGTKDFKKKMEELDKIVLSDEQIEDLKLKIFGFNNETEQAKKLKLKNPEKSVSKNDLLLKKIDESIQTEFARTGKTAFGLLQGVTFYTNHVANVKEKNQKQKYSNSEYIRFNQGVKTNNKAQELLFGLIKPRKAKAELVVAN